MYQALSGAEAGLVPALLEEVGVAPGTFWTPS